MFVVDRVELVLRDQVEQVGELERDHAVGLERDAQAADEIVDARHVGEDVVAEEKVGRRAVGGELLRGLHAEELHEARDLPFLAGDLRDVRRGLDAEHRDAPGLEMLQQVAVVARDLDHLRLRPKAEPLDHHLAVAPRVLDPAARVAAEVEVVAEDRVGRLELLELAQQARVAHPHLERVELLGALCVVSFHIRVGQGREPEVAHDVLERRAAEAARGCVVAVGRC